MEDILSTVAYHGKRKDLERIDFSIGVAITRPYNVDVAWEVQSTGESAREDVGSSLPQPPHYWVYSGENFFF